MLTQRPGIGPLRVRMLQFIGADPNITELRMMLCAPAYERDCYQAVMRHLASVADQWDWVAWEGLGSDIGAEAETRDPLECAYEKSAFILCLPSTWEEFKTGLGRNIKQSLRHCYNSLKRDGLMYRLEVLTGADEIAAALPDFFRMHAARANVKGMVKHPDVFASPPQAQEFLIEICQRLALRGSARVFQLWVDDKLVSTRIGFSMGDTLYLYYSGWDPAYSRYSVMTTLLAEVIRYAIAQGLGRVNLSTGNDVSKTRWGAHEVRYTAGRHLSRRRKARVVHLMWRSLVRARTSKGARVLTPAFLVRNAPAAAAPIQERFSLHLPGVGHFGLGVLAAAVATIGAVDMLDGVLDGMLHVASIFVG
jgi:CelD/BcsL family acetyltransferase involved in cellulose biosynthesis